MRMLRMLYSLTDITTPFLIEYFICNNSVITQMAFANIDELDGYGEFVGLGAGVIRERAIIVDTIVESIIQNGLYSQYRVIEGEHEEIIRAVSREQALCAYLVAHGSSSLLESNMIINNMHVNEFVEMCGQYMNANGIDIELL